MYYVGLAGCPHCGLRTRVCVETDGPAVEGAAILVRCPNDNSARRVSLAALEAVAECPPGVQPEWLEDFEPADPPTAWDGRLAFAFAAAGLLGAAALFAAWWLWF
jgi:hypothetical protein